MTGSLSSMDRDLTTQGLPFTEVKHFFVLPLGLSPLYRWGKLRNREIEQLLKIILLIMKEAGIVLKFIWFQNIKFYSKVNPTPPLPPRDILPAFLKIWPLSLRLFSIRKKNYILAPCNDIPDLKQEKQPQKLHWEHESFILSLFLCSLLSLELWKDGGVGGTQSHNVFSLLLPKCSFRATSIRLVPPRHTPHQPDVLTPTYHVQLSCSSLALLWGGNSLVLSTISCRNPTVHQHPCISS